MRKRAHKQHLNIRPSYKKAKKKALFLVMIAIVIVVSFGTVAALNYNKREKEITNQDSGTKLIPSNTQIIDRASIQAGLNNIRQENGLSALKPVKELDVAASARGQDMINLQYFDNTGHSPDGFLVNAGYKYSYYKLHSASYHVSSEQVLAWLDKESAFTLDKSVVDVGIAVVNHKYQTESKLVVIYLAKPRSGFSYPANICAQPGVCDIDPNKYRVSPDAGGNITAPTINIPEYSNPSQPPPPQKTYQDAENYCRGALPESAYNSSAWQQCINAYLNS